MNDEAVKILLIDDDEDDYNLTRELFSLVKAGEYVLDWASSYEEGLRVIQRGEHDVCLVDFGLGKRSGVELIRESRKARLTTPMILLTGQGDRDVDLAAMDAGATDYLVKDETSPSRLERTIRYAVQLNLERRRMESELGAYAQRHAAVAEIGRLALTGGDLKDLFAEVVRIVSRTLAVEYSNIMETLPERDALILSGGVGWNDEYAVGEVIVGADRESQAGFTLLSDEPVVVEDLRTEMRFRAAPLLVDHGVVSGMTVIIRGGTSPYGVLGAHTTSLRKFTTDDVNFLRSVANVLAEAVARSRAENELRTDITTRKQVENALRESDEKFHQLADHITDVFWIRSADMSELHYVSPAFERVWGRSVASLFANPQQWSDFIVPEDRERVQAAFDELTRDVPGLDVEYRIARPNGEIRWVRVRGFQVRDAGDQLIRHTGIVTDITERKRTELERDRLLLELEVEKARLVDIFTNAPAFIASLRGPEHVFELANSGYYDLVGQREVIGRKVRDVFPELEGQSFFELLDEVYASGIRFVGNEMPVELSNGSDAPHDVRYINFVYHPLRDLEGKVSSIICHGVDVTEQVLSRRRLQESEDQLRQAQKLESVGLLAGGIAHDFNNLLTVITGYSDLTLRHLNEVDPIARHVEEIKKAADKAALLTRQLLAFSRKQLLQPKVIDLNATVLDIGKMIQRLLGENVELHITPGVKLGLVKADPGQIQQVILNLSINARDSFSKDGQVTIETANVFLDEEYALSHVAVRPGWYVMLSVSDTGCGMDVETQKHIFEPFFTTKEQGKGTGLGLAMVYGIVKQSGGNIWVFSEVGKGTTFRIYLPLVEDQLHESITDAHRPEIAAGTETILLAEDDEMVRNLTRESLKMNGYDVLEASNGLEALVASEQFKGPIHLLLTDVVMPGMSGRELADKLLTLRPDTHVLFMSGYTDRFMFNRGVLDDHLAFIQKPFTPDSLALKVAEVLGGQNHHNSVAIEDAPYRRVGD